VIKAATNTPGKPIPVKGASFPETLSLLLISPGGKTIYADGITSGLKGFIVPVSTATGAAAVRKALSR
jgi:hypothetical protein